MIFFKDFNCLCCHKKSVSVLTCLAAVPGFAKKFYFKPNRTAYRCHDSTFSRFQNNTGIGLFCCPYHRKAAVAAGADGIFMEVHKDPDKALCDGPNSLALDAMPGILSQLKSIRDAL